MLKLTRKLALHPILLWLYPIWFLYWLNRGQVTLPAVARSFLFFLILSTLVLGFFRWRLRAWRAAGLAASLAGVLFFSYRPAHYVLTALLGGQGGLALAVLLGAAWVAAFAAGLAFAVRGRLARPTMILNLAALALFLFTPFTVSPLSGQPRAEDPMLQTIPARFLPAWRSLPQAAPQANPPDIYYIILDGYARADVLQTIYGVDNSPFYDFLRKNDFTIQEHSHANYSQTLLSLTSALNFAYLDQLFSVDSSYYSRAPVVKALLDARLTRFLRAQGYQIIALETGYEFTDLYTADVLARSPFALNAFENQLISSSAAGFALQGVQMDLFRARVIDRFNQLPRIARQPGPKFVFAHMVMPHPPFVFDSQGRPTAETELNIADGSHNQLPDEEYIRRYAAQLTYITRLTTQAIQGVLRNSPTPPVIILQSDHGPGAYLDWESAEKTCLRERLSILNAYHLPGESLAANPAVTPVNTFRLVLNAYFDAGLDPLADKNYYTAWNQPYRYIEVTNRVDTCAR